MSECIMPYLGALYGVWRRDVVDSVRLISSSRPSKDIDFNGKIDVESRQ